MSGELAALLKSRTADSHRRLEHRLDLMNPALTLPAYLLRLKTFHALVAPWEALLATKPALIAGERVGDRNKIALLIEDLGHFGIDTASVELSSHWDFLATACDGAWLGAMYVMEGATLGGGYIAPHLSRIFGLHDNAGCRYFVPYRGRTGSMWQAFRKQLDAVPAEEFEPAVVAAERTFEILDHGFAVTLERA